MTMLVLLLRIVSLVAFVGPVSFTARRPAGGSPVSGAGSRRTGARLPLVANLASFGVFCVALAIASGSAAAASALPLAIAGAMLAIAGAGIVHRSRAALGAAWSLAPRADHEVGLVTTGPYRHVRHPIYLGLSLLALGQAITFANWPALAVVLLAIVPTFAWRAHAEEKLLRATFDERFEEYRRRTPLIIPAVRG
jgi:protein-S-isoprenylcysteine O-methyltransferase Ste14